MADQVDDEDERRHGRVASTRHKDDRRPEQRPDDPHRQEGPDEERHPRPRDDVAGPVDVAHCETEPAAN